MTAEYALREGETLQQLARELLDAADNPSQVAWSHRPDTYGGGVFVVTDDAVAQRVLERRQLFAAQAEAEPVEEAQLDDEGADDEEGGEGGDDTATEPADDEPKLTTAQKRRAAREARAAEEAAQKAAEAAAQDGAPAEADAEQKPE